MGRWLLELLWLSGKSLNRRADAPHADVLQSNPHRRAAMQLKREKSGRLAFRLVFVDADRHDVTIDDVNELVAVCDHD